MEQMNEKYYLLKFYRKAVHKPLQAGEEEALLTMDYFDALKVRTFELNDDHLRRFMGLSVSEELTENDTAMQSIPVYSPRLDSEEYFCNNPFYGDPLLIDEGSEQGYYLGIIQVYITPEMMARYMCEKQLNKENMNSGLDLYNIYYRDLHAILAQYVKSLQDNVFFSYRIFKSLSVGDFIVAVKCTSPDIPFRVAALIRRRKIHLVKCDLNNDSAPHENLVLYKTYTSLSMNSHVFQYAEELQSSETNDGYFVLRCVLSNKYWSDEQSQGAAKKYNLNAFVDSPICLRLNGRYDFSVILGEKAFYSVFPVLMQYKLDLALSDVPHYLGNKDEIAFCRMLYELIKGGYISHVNERYVFNCSVPDEGKFYEELEKAENSAGLTINLTEAEQRFPYLNISIRQKILALKARIKESYIRILKIDTANRSPVYSIRLLEKLANNCSSINGSSDSRIYAGMIVEQINAVLDGTEEFLDYIEEVSFDAEEEYDDTISMLDENLKRSVEYINSFSKYVLDSSLQSIQTPHYNLETHVSAEKLLMAYSSFMRRILDWYEMNARDIELPAFEFVPVMVPQPLSAALNTELLFNWSRFYVGKASKDTNTRIADRDNPSARKNRRRLLPVLCPSFNELTDFAGVIGNLFHETAHRLRYEDRLSRNKVILMYSERLLFTMSARSIVKEVARNMGTFDDGNAVELFLQEILADAYHEAVVSKYPDFEDIADMRYIRLLGAIEECYEQFIKALNYIMDLTAAIAGFTMDEGVLSDGKRYENSWRLALDLKIFLDADTRTEKKKGGNEDNGGWEEKYNRTIIALYESLLEVRGEDRESARNLSLCLDELLQVQSGGGNYTGEIFSLDHETLHSHKAVIEFCDVLNRLFAKRVSTAGMDRQADSARIRRGERIRRVDARKLRRLLGLDSYKTRNKADKFAEFAALHISSKSETAYKYFAQMAELYCEASSDLFMVEMLGLTEYGYLNFISRYVPVSDKMADTYLKRCSMVLYALWDGKIQGAFNLGEKKPAKEWGAIYINILEHIKSFSEHFADTAPEDIRIVDGENSQTLRHILFRIAELSGYEVYEGEKKGLSAVEIESVLVDIIRIFGTVISSIDEKNWSDSRHESYLRKFIIELRRCRYLCSNYMQIGYEYNKVKEELEQFDFVADDLIKGDKNLKSLHRRFIKDRVIWPYCEKVRDCFNRSDITQYEYEAQNQCMTDFVLDMHYRMMFEAASECMKKAFDIR